MKYDKTDVPLNYDRGRIHSSETQKMWLGLIDSWRPQKAIHSIADIGCGTGRFMPPLESWFGIPIFGLDISWKMLSEARAKVVNSHDNLSMISQANAELIPLSTGKTDIVFISMALHHIADKPKAAAECRRIMSPGGRLYMRASTKENKVAYYDFFPRTRQMIEAELLRSKDIHGLFMDAGLQYIHTETVNQQMSPDWKTYYQKISTKSDSFIARLPETEFEEGMNRLRLQAEEANQNESVFHEIDFFVFEKP